MVISENLAVSAGIFTTNLVKGHSLCGPKIKFKAGTRAIVINSGCANACLGTRGDNDAADMALYASSLIECERTRFYLVLQGLLVFHLIWIK